MRKLQFSDVFNSMRLIKEANLKNEMRPIIEQAAKGELDVTNIGIDGMLSVIEIVTEKKAEQAFYKVLAEPFEMTAKEVEAMSLDDISDSFEQLAKENNVKRFFMSLSGIMKKA